MLNIFWKRWRGKFRNIEIFHPFYFSHVFNKSEWNIHYIPKVITVKTSPRCSSSSNNVNLQRSRYSRLKWDIDKLKYEKWSKYRFNKPKCIVMGPPKKPEKGQEWTYPQQELIVMFESIESKPALQWFIQQDSFTEVLTFLIKIIDN